VTIRSWNPLVTVHEIHNRGTRYQLHAFESPNFTFLMFMGRGENFGTWLRLPKDEDDNDVAYGYIAEKANLSHGDRDGWIELIEAATNLRVFI
jgi:hypothetical protein